MAVSPLNDAYTKYSKDSKDNGGLVILAISAYFNDTDSTVIEYKNKHNITYPIVSGDTLGGNGGLVSMMFKTINALPTIILIAPDKKIVEKNIWPATTITPTIEKYNYATPILNKDEKFLNYLNDYMSILIVNKNKLAVTIMEPGLYKISTFTANGRRIESISKQFFSSGQKYIDLESGFNKNSLYFIEVEYHKGNVIKKLIF